MKTILIAIMVLLASTVYSAPYLTSDPQVGVTKYKFEVAEVNDVAHILVEESDALITTEAYHDIGDWPFGKVDGVYRAGGEYIVDGQPQGIWRWSDPTPFELIIPDTTGPSGTQLEE